MSYENGLQEAFGCLITVAVVSVLGCIFFFVFYFLSAEKVESNKLITPEIRLEVNNNKVDTIYVYENK